MSVFKYFTAIFIIAEYVYCYGMARKLDDEPENLYLTRNMNMFAEEEKVDLKVYYESLCPDCTMFFKEYLLDITTSLHKYLNISLYPYGNAETKIVDDHYEITCQHGEKECYGNKLHACAIDILKNVTKSTLYNCCLMLGYSTDDDANECGKSMEIDANPIKECAKGDRGNELLKYYGDENAKVDYIGVPCVLINGVRHKNKYKESICAAFKNPPPPCKSV